MVYPDSISKLQAGNVFLNKGTEALYPPRSRLVERRIHFFDLFDLLVLQQLHPQVLESRFAFTFKRAVHASIFEINLCCCGNDLHGVPIFDEAVSLLLELVRSLDPLLRKLRAILFQHQLDTVLLLLRHLLGVECQVAVAAYVFELHYGVELDGLVLEFVVVVGVGLHFSLKNFFELQDVPLDGLAAFNVGHVVAVDAF